MSTNKSNLQPILQLIHDFCEDHQDNISGSHIKASTGNLTIFFNEELPADTFKQLNSDISSLGEFQSIYNEEEYGVDKSTKSVTKTCDARITFFEGSGKDVAGKLAQNLKELGLK